MCRKTQEHKLEEVNFGNSPDCTRRVSAYGHVRPCPSPPPVRLPAGSAAMRGAGENASNPEARQCTNHRAMELDSQPEGQHSSPDVEDKGLGIDHLWRSRSTLKSSLEWNCIVLSSGSSLWAIRNGSHTPIFDTAAPQFAPTALRFFRDMRRLNDGNLERRGGRFPKCGRITPIRETEQATAG